MCNESCGIQLEIIVNPFGLVGCTRTFKGVFYLIYFFMIYKFKDHAEKIMEVELFNKENFIEQCIDSIDFTITNENEDSIYFSMTKIEVFKLIGALHLLHKEME